MLGHQSDFIDEPTPLPPHCPGLETPREEAQRLLILASKDLLQERTTAKKPEQAVDQIPEEISATESSLPAVEKAQPPKKVVRPSKGVYRDLLVAFYYTFLLGIFIHPWLITKKVSGLKEATSVEQGIKNLKAAPSPNMSLEPETIQSIQPISHEGEQQYKKDVISYQYRLGKYDYPSLLAYACGKKGRNGFEALKWIQQHNPQVNWEKKKFFHKGETYTTPCQLTDAILRGARQELRKKKEQVPRRV